MSAVDRIREYLEHHAELLRMSGTDGPDPGTVDRIPNGTSEGAPLTVADLESLLADSDKLAALESAGVDNWEGYGIAVARAEYYGEESDR